MKLLSIVRTNLNFLKKLKLVYKVLTLRIRKLIFLRISLMDTSVYQSYESGQEATL